MISLFPQTPPGRVLIFGAHPDDAEFGAGGTLARLAKAGADVTIVVSSVPSQYETRVQEAERGAALLGARLVVLFPKPCRVEDVPMHVLVGAMDTVVETHRPDLVLVHSHSDLHWDHTLVTRAAMSALRRTPANLLAFFSSYELNPQPGHGECYFDISQTIELKMAALAAHTSQQKGLNLESTRQHAQALGRKCGATSAEVFEVLRLKL